MRHSLLLVFAFLAFFSFSCDDANNARIEVWLTDDPGDYQEVNIDLQAVEIHSSETGDERGWQSLDVTPRVYDLLTLTNGEETLLGSLDLPGGRISQIRLKLGENNTIKVDDKILQLATPSAQQSGLKVQIQKVLAEGITYKIVLDFDAARSVVKTGNGDFILKPVIRALTEAVDGAITGVVDPAAAVSIAVMSGEEVITTTTSSDDGKFLIRGLDAGTYTLVFDGPGDAPVLNKEGIVVAVGEITDLGTVTMEQ